MLKEASIIGVWWGTWAANNPGLQIQNMSELAALISDGALRPEVTESFPLGEFEKAFQLISERRALGKVILQIA